MALNNNTDLGFRDLLFNSGVACMLLFIIFSVRIGKENIQVESVTQRNNLNYQFQDQYSMIVSEVIKEGNYKSLLAVEVQGVSPDEFSSIKSSRIIEWSDSDNPNHFIFYHEKSQRLTFYLVVGKLPFSSISLKILPNNILNHPFIVSAKLIDGKGILEKEGSETILEYTWSEKITLREKEFIFRPAQLTQISDFSTNLIFDLR